MMMTDVVVCFDCDNTLFDNDAVERDLRAHLTEHFGAEGAARYRADFESLRSELGYADYLGAVQRFRTFAPNDPELLRLGDFLLDYPFRTRLYPMALEVVAACAPWSTTMILTDGDSVFQPHKLRRSGIWGAVDGRVLIDVHKETELDGLAARYPARHYVMIDDKVRVLAAMKDAWGDRLTTVFPMQGHYAHDASVAQDRAPDVTVAAIGDLLQEHHLAKIRQS